jgi:histidinol phosphatase-like PHP family hydrolase
MITRRDFIKTSAIGGTLAFLPNALFTGEDKNPDFPVIDYHVHITDYFPIEKAFELAEQRKIKFGIVEHPGLYYALKSDKELEKYLDSLSKFPVHKGIQPVVPDWSKNFSPELLNRLDYILMDALTLPEKNNKWTPIWRIDYFVENKNKFMDKYMRFIEDLLKSEPMNIFAWPTFLPTAIARNYDELWTDDRMQVIIDLALDKNIALEINEISHVPNDRFINKAKNAGVKFTFGTDARDNNAGRFAYCFEMAATCGLTKENMFYLA